jgi:ABC-type lipoprotein release transport system permease subunit
VGILDGLSLYASPPRTIESPSLAPDLTVVSSGVFVTLRTSQKIFGRPTLTDGLVVARTPAEVPALVNRLREAFRLEPGVFIVEHYSQFRRKVHDYALTLAFFALISISAAMLAGSFAARLLHDVYSERRHQYATLMALGFSPAQSAAVGLTFGIIIAFSSASVGTLLAITLAPARFAMPSLVADLGTIVPKFDLRVVCAIAGLAAAAVSIGMTPTAWRIFRRPIAATLLETGR